MHITSIPITLICILVSLFLVSSAQPCSNYTFTSNRVFGSCIDLPFLQAHLHWTYKPSTRQVEIAYRANQTSEGWISWAINPNNAGMLGSQALVAFHNANGSMTVYPTPITSYNPSMAPGTLSIKVSNISAEYSRNQMTIFAVVGPLDNGTTVNLVWQSGSSVSSNVPQMHHVSGENVKSMGRLNFLAG